MSYLDQKRLINSFFFFKPTKGAEVTVRELKEILKLADDNAPVVFEVQTKGIPGDTSWSIDRSVERHGFLILVSDD